MTLAVLVAIVLASKAIEVEAILVRWKYLQRFNSVGFSEYGLLSKANVKVGIGALEKVVAAIKESAGLPWIRGTAGVHYTIQEIAAVEVRCCSW